MSRNPASSRAVRPTLCIAPAEPLWRRVPARDEDNHPLADFMMIIPRLGRRPAQAQGAIIALIEGVLRDHAPHVVFADLNLRLNILWVSLRPVPGLSLEIAAAIFAHVPEARLVGPRPPERRGQAAH